MPAPVPRPDPSPAIPASASAGDCRRRRRAAGWNAAAATLLAAILALLVNVIGLRLYGRMPISPHLYGELTERTLQVLRHTEGDLQLIAFFEAGHPLAAPVRALLQEFSEASRSLPNLRIRVRIVDPNRDVAVASDLAHRFAVERNRLIVLTRTHHRILTPEDLVVTHATDSSEMTLADFAGEAAVSAAIWNTIRTGRPAVCFLAGNGEHDPLDFDRLNGYSSIARHLRRSWYDVRRLELSPTTPIPEDCALLVAAGPRTSLPVQTLERIATYLSTGGRMFLLLDNATDPGLRDLLRDWGIELLPPARTPDNGNSNIRTGHSLRPHPVTRGLTRAEVTFESPCRFTVTGEALQPEHADKPQAVPLLGASAELRRMAAAPDLKKPPLQTALAVASERGARSGAERTYLARMVAVGDAQFAANAIIDGGLNANRDFFLSAVHWLTEQEALIGRTPVTYRILRSGISPGAWWMTALRVAVLWPLALWFVGLALTYSRRARNGRS